MEIKDIISSGFLELYVTGLTSDEETKQVEQWAKQYPEVRKEIVDLQHVMERYALAEAVPPDEALKERILAKIEPDKSVKDKIFTRIQTQPKQEPFSVIKTPEKIDDGKVRSISYYKWAVAASVILLIGSLALNYIFYNKYQKQQQLAAAMHKDMDVVTDKYAMPVVLNGTPHAPEALAKIFWMKNTGDVYVDPTNLPETPAGKQYQLWAIVDGKPVDAGMITTQKGVYHIQKMKTFGKAQAFAITLEKAGGSATPTMDEMIVQAKI